MADNTRNPASILRMFDTVCKDMMIGNMLRMLQAAEIEGDLVSSVCSLKELGSKEVADATTIVQQVVTSSMVARQLENVKEQEEEQRRQKEFAEGLFNIGKRYS